MSFRDRTAPLRWLVCVWAFATPALAQDLISVHCSVFHDLDGDGVRQAGEPALPGIHITNGYDVFATDAAGEVDLTVDRLQYRFATLTIPRGYWPSTPWFHWVPVGTAGPDTVAFGLETSAASAADTVHWVHIADTQVYSSSDPVKVSDDLLEINQLADPPLFVINTGDLVEVGSDTTHWENYVDQLTVSDFPVLPVVGNHDLNGTSLDYYELYVGPPYYSFEAGDWHFVVYNSELPTTTTPVEDAWLLNDLAVATPGAHRALFQHRPLTDVADTTLAKWSSLGILADFSGHWHCTQFATRPNGMLDFNISRTTRGPADRTPRVFGIVTCADDGTISYDLRRLRVSHRSAITHPASGETVGSDFLEILVQAYDTSSLVTGLTATVSGTGGSLPATPLTREGISLWRATPDASSLPDGTYSVTVTGSFADGTAINLVTIFAVSDVVPIKRSPATDWPMFRKCPEGSSFVATPLPPPLELAWTTAVPGMVAMSSPVVAQGKVYLGTRGETGVGDAGLVCVDGVTGQTDWQTGFVGGGIALTPAVSQGRVIVNALSEYAYSFDAASGAPQWSVPLPYPGYNVTGVTVEEPFAWVGGEPFAKQVATASGAASWTTAWLGSPFFPYLYSAPAVDAANVYYSFFSLPGSGEQSFAIASRATGTVSYSEEGTFRSTIVAGDTLYVVGGLDRHNSELTARDATGAVLWTAPQTVGGGTASPALGNGVLVLAAESGDIQGFRISDGLRIWSHPVGPELFDMIAGVRSGNGSIATAAIADSVAYVGSLDGNLYALDLATGAELWRWYLGVPVASSAAISGNMLYVGASDGHLYAFQSPGGPVTAAAEVGGRAGALSLYAPSPNPSARTTRIAWAQPSRAHVRVRVFDVAGRLVRTLAERTMDGGQHELAWNGTNEAGRAVAAGVYLVQVEAGGERSVRRFVRIR